MRTKTDVLGMKLTCANAAENGHFECLKYAHENGMSLERRDLF